MEDEEDEVEGLLPCSSVVEEAVLSAPDIAFSETSAALCFVSAPLVTIVDHSMVKRDAPIATILGLTI